MVTQPADFKLEDARLVVGGITVMVDHVSDSLTSRMIEILLTNTYAKHFSEVENENDPIYTVAIEVVERSFLDGLTPKKTILFQISLLDDTNTVRYRNVAYSVGKKTIISAEVQSVLLKKVMQPLFPDKS